MTQTIGVVGLGNMGSGMARSLLRAGHTVAGYDVRPEAAAAITGLRPAATLAELARQSQIVLVMVLNYPQVEAALFDADGLAGALAPGATIIVSSTISPAQTRQLGARLGERGFVYIDAPVSGGAVRAGEGTLTMMAGAPQAVFDAHQPVLAAMATNLFHCGEVGTGQTAKMCNQLMAGVTFMASAECLALGAAAGMNTRLLWEILGTGAGDCWMMRNRGVHMLDTYETGSRLDTFAKDLGIVLDTADQYHLPLLIATAARQWITLGIASGYGPLDDAHVIKLLESYTGASVREAAGN
ncbi:MAG: NAD(P)-dependent oxidoreductase [Chloroflexi bacterium]|nr:NAD(P)-dependent oxidoreductase [Chloroflexota bacterium]